MFCQNCKAALPDSAKFCTMCGAKTDVTFCSNGHVLERNETACRYCPPATGQGKATASLSTTVEKASHPAQPVSVLKVTTVETGTAGGSVLSSPIGLTRIMREKDEEPVAMLGWLVIVEGDDLWKDFKITKRRMTMGRASDCDIVLDHSEVSMKHASFKLLPDGLYLTDLDSTNGTFVNDQEVDKQKLMDNDTVRIGPVTMKFKAF
jgi:hypothetical protein